MALHSSDQAMNGSRGESAEQVRNRDMETIRNRNGVPGDGPGNADGNQYGDGQRYQGDNDGNQYGWRNRENHQQQEGSGATPAIPADPGTPGEAAIPATPAIPAAVAGK
jgi:hypothetical protein